MVYKIRMWCKEHPARSWNLLAFLLFQFAVMGACTHVGGTYFGWYMANSFAFAIATIISFIASFENGEWTPRNRNYRSYD